MFDFLVVPSLSEHMTRWPWEERMGFTGLEGNAAILGVSMSPWWWLMIRRTDGSDQIAIKNRDFRPLFYKYTKVQETIDPECYRLASSLLPPSLACVHYVYNFISCITRTLTDLSWATMSGLSQFTPYFHHPWRGSFYAAVTAVLASQWGDEGKDKLVDILVQFHSNPQPLRTAGPQRLHG